MFRMILATQWKWTRVLLLPATILAFAVPLLSMRMAASGFSPADYVGRMQVWGVAYALLAGAVGLGVALAAWAHDQRGRHVYALILPVSRAKYVLLRLAAGASFLAAPVVAVLLGSLVAIAVSPIPYGLHAYPIALTLRFALAALVAFALFFSIGAATQRTAGIVLGAVAALFLAQYVLGLVEVRFNLLGQVADFLFTSPGVFSVFAGRWTLVDA